MLNNVQTSQILPQILNISTYKFIELQPLILLELKQNIYNKCQEYNLKGTIILATEGINIFLAGLPENINNFFHWFNQINEFNDIKPKESISEKIPFRRLIVKIKPEIITMRLPVIRPQKKRAPSVAAKTLARWLSQGHDDKGKPVVMLDTRNDFEVKVGTFNNALNYGLNKFTDFMSLIENNKQDLENKTVVSFCTGGIRCEKAALYMQNLGFEDIYQLEGGILKYFEEVGEQHYTGDCFVFDYRTALSADLKVTGHLQCYGCRAVISLEDQKSEFYKPPLKCPHCANERDKIILAKQQKIQNKIYAKMSKRKEYKKQQKILYSNTVINNLD